MDIEDIFEETPSLDKELEEKVEEQPSPLDLALAEEDGSLEIEEELSDFDENLALKFDTAQEQALVTKMMELLELDAKSNQESRDLYAEGLKRTGLSKEAPGGAGFSGASRTVHPVLAEAAIDFQSRILKELLPAVGPVKVKVDSDKFSVEKYKKARKKEKYLNDQLTKKIKEYIPSMEQLAAQVPLNGDQYLKLYWDSAKNRIACSYVPSDRILIPSSAVSFESAERKTEIIPYSKYDLEQCIKSGLYKKIDIVEHSNADEPDKTEPEKVSKKIIGLSDEEELIDSISYVYEIHVMLDWNMFGIKDIDPLANDGYAPYIVSIDSYNQKLLAVYRNWNESDLTKQPLSYYVQFQFIPWRGPKAIGLVQLIGSLSGALTGAIRALLDAAHIQNAPTALKLKFGKASGKNYNIEIGQVNEFEAESGVNDIRQMFMPLPFNPPSPVLYQLMGDLDKLARGVIRTSFDQMAESNANVPVGTTLNRIEQGMMVFSSIYARFHRAQQKVIDIICRLTEENLVEDADEDPFKEEDSKPTREDFKDSSDLMPASDPNIFTNSQRIAQAQLVLELATKNPELYNLREAHKMMLEYSNVQNIDGLLPPPENQKDENPVTENVKIGMGTPAFALPDQDHLAHLENHLRWALSPAFGMNPTWFKKSGPLIVEHIKQHVLLHYAANSVNAASDALGIPIQEVIDDHPLISEGVSQLLALQSQDVIIKTERQLQQALQAIALLEQKIAQLQPPPMMDPTQAQLQISQQQAQAAIESKKIDAQVKVQEQERKAQKDTIDQKLEELRLELENSKLAIEQERLRLQEQQTIADNQTEVLKNVQDNNTAVDIAQMRLAAGKSVGNLQNGDGIDPGNGV